MDDDARGAGTTLGMDVDGNHLGRHGADSDWSWPPYAPVETSAGPFETPEWAPASSVEHPLLRLGRWTVLYRRSA